METKRKLISAKEVSEQLGISLSYAYRIIDQLNSELERSGYITIRGRVDELYYQKRIFPPEEKILI